MAESEEHMQAMLVIIQAQDTSTVLDRLKALNLPCLLPIASAGGFLQQGNTALLMAMQPEQLSQVMGILNDTCQQRTTFMPAYYIEAAPTISAFPLEVEVGGATIFSCEIEHFEVF
jgi:uncharacterized protein YaaQ